MLPQRKAHGSRGEQAGSTSGSYEGDQAGTHQHGETAYKPPLGGTSGGRSFLELRHTRPWFLLVGMLLLSAWLTACGQPGSPGGGGAQATSTPTSVPSPAGTSTLLPTETAGPVALHVGATTYHITDTIPVMLRNQSTQTIYFPDHLTNCAVILLQLGVVNRFLPSGEGAGILPHRGSESETAITRSFLTVLGQRALYTYNESGH